MRKIRVLFGLGVWVAILPYLGFPYTWKNILFSITGLGLIYVTFLIYREHTKREAPKEKDETFDNFSENSGFN